MPIDGARTTATEELKEVRAEMGEFERELEENKKEAYEQASILSEKSMELRKLMIQLQSDLPTLRDPHDIEQCDRRIAALNFAYTKLRDQYFEQLGLLRHDLEHMPRRYKQLIKRERELERKLYKRQRTH